MEVDAPSHDRRDWVIRASGIATVSTKFAERISGRQGSSTWDGFHGAGVRFGAGGPTHEHGCSLKGF